MLNNKINRFSRKFVFCDAEHTNSCRDTFCLFYDQWHPVTKKKEMYFLLLFFQDNKCHRAKNEKKDGKFLFLPTFFKRVHVFYSECQSLLNSNPFEFLVRREKYRWKWKGRKQQQNNTRDSICNTFFGKYAIY